MIKKKKGEPRYGGTSLGSRRACVLDYWEIQKDPVSKQMNKRYEK